MVLDRGGSTTLVGLHGRLARLLTEAGLIEKFTVDPGSAGGATQPWQSP